MISALCVTEVIYAVHLVLSSWWRKEVEGSMMGFKEVCFILASH